MGPWVRQADMIVESNFVEKYLLGRYLQQKWKPYIPHCTGSTPDSHNVTFGSKPSKWQQQSSPLAHCRKVSTWTSSKLMGGINMLDTYFS